MFLPKLRRYFYPLGILASVSYKKGDFFKIFHMQESGSNFLQNLEVQCQLGVANHALLSLS